MAESRTALLAGATGLIGRYLLQILLDAPEYQRVTVLTRRSLGITHPKLNEQLVDFAALEQKHAAAVAGVTDLYCCLGTTIRQAGSQAAFRQVDYEYPLALGRLAAQHGVAKYLIVTSVGANPGSTAFYTRVKGEVEEALKVLSLPGLYIYRPSLLLGEREKSRPAEAVAAVIWRAVAPLMGGGLRKYRPIHGTTVARAMYRTALQAAPGVHTYESDAVAHIGT